MNDILSEEMEEVYDSGLSLRDGNTGSATADGSARFNSRIGYIMVAAGAAVGLGNIWKFPYLVYGDGGGTFLVMYLIVAVLLARPQVAIESAIGRHGRSNPVDAFGKINSKWKFVGVINVLCTVMICFYYMIVSGYILKYTVAFFTGADFGTDKAAYYFNFISRPLEPLIYGAIILTFTVFVLTKGLTGKVESFCKFMMPALMVLLAVCGVWAFMTSDDPLLGLKFYFVPSMDKLNFGTFADACMQVLFSVGIGWAIFTTLGASVGDDHDLRADAAQISFFDTFVAVLAGFAIIPAVVGSGSKMTSGPSLIFEAMTTIFAKLPGGNIIGGMFFLAVLFAVLSSAFTFVEIPARTLSEKVHISHTKACVAVGIVLYIGGIFCSLSQGSGLLSGIRIPWIYASEGLVYYNIYNWVDTFTGYVLLPLGTFLTAVFATRVWGYNSLEKELMKGGGKSISTFDKVTMGIIDPIIAIIIMAHAFGVDVALGLA
ncbi:sodium-dependent transporter [Mobilibacterium timonense]|uniref:sodium-dependent transporter n=1 Tax=Mobilibacterium timonense TaxID=1871012 RepID=UPI000986A783|nr:sodium-dependent transporter [Mobilibacterium timonense]